MKKNINNFKFYFLQKNGGVSMNCETCGHQITKGLNSCPSCGKIVFTNYTTHLSEDLRLFIGEKYLYYESKWTKYLTTQKSFNLDVNTAALGLGPIWMLYRKMYLHALITILLLILLTFILPSKFPFLLINLAISIYADKLYFDYVRRKIRKIRLSNMDSTEDHIREEIVKAGGTTNLATWVAVIMAIGILISYYNYFQTFPGFHFYY